MQWEDFQRSNIGNSLSAFCNSEILEKFTYAEEKHYADSLGEIAQSESADSCDSHEEILIKEVSGFYIFKCRFENIESENKVSRDVYSECKREDIQCVFENNSRYKNCYTY